MTQAIEENELATVERLARAAAGPVELALGSYYAVPTSDGDVRQIDLTGDQYRDQPRHKQGTITVRDVDSFGAYWRKHADADSEIYASRADQRVVAVLDAHTETSARWQQHRLHLALRHSTAWGAWSLLDGKYMDQENFAEFIEDNRADIADPPAAAMLEVVQSIQGTTKAEWQAGTLLANGQRRLSYVETTSATAGAKGSLEVPAEFTLRLPVFEGAQVADELLARFRYRINGGKLSLAYKLDRPADVVATAFDAIAEQIAAQLDVTVMRGTPG